MLKFNFLKSLILLATFSIFLFSCGDDNDNPPQSSNTIVDVASANADFTFLVAAIETANLATTLQGAGPFTVFAPTNAAFIEAGYANEAAVRAESPTTLAAILQNHVVSGEVRSTALSDGLVANSLQTVGSGSGTSSNLYFAVNSNGVWVNEAEVTSADLSASNGVIHVIDKVLTAGDLTSIVVNNPNFSFLEAALTEAGLVATFQGTTNYTVFAPTNDAFIAAGFADETAVRNAGSAALTPILTNHAVTNNVFSSDLSNGITAGTLSNVGGMPGVPSNLYFGISDDGVWVNEAQVTGTDLVSSNGVIHVIDAVLTTGSVADLVINNPNFSTLEVGVTTAPASLAATLDGTGTFTVFAPDNTAFVTFATDTGTDITTLTADNFNNIVLSHALTSEVYSNGIPSTTVTTANTAEALTFDGTTTFVDPNMRNITIQRTDIKVSNGVVHVIDNVILPEDL